MIDERLSKFPKISDYGMIGNCRTSALVSNRGSIEWCCFPHFDSPSFFATMLDREEGGFFSIAPATSPAFEVRSEQRYYNETNVLETKFIAEGATCRVLDCFSVTTEENKRTRLWPNHEIIRIVEGLSGNLPMRMQFVPRPHYGRKSVKLHHRGMLGVHCNIDQELLILQSSLNPNRLFVRERNEMPETIADFQVHAGEKVVFSLTYADEAPAIIPPLGDQVLERFDETVRYWKSWISRCQYHGPYADHVRRSALALKLLTFAPSGAIIAAPTTSLPERVGATRNWDYRYCWLRDASFTVRALVSLGYYEEAQAFLSWMLHSTRLTRPKLQVVYTVYGESRVPEHDLTWLSGYRGSKPVRVGNGASDQLQLDVYGEVLSAVYQLVPHIGSFDKETKNFLLGLGRSICEDFNKPDDGIWEVRSGQAQHTHSKVMSWVALDRLVKITRQLGWKVSNEQQSEFCHTRSVLRGLIEERGYNAKIKAYTGVFEDSALDSSLLVMPLFGYCDADSERMTNTREAISQGLAKNGLIYRYRNVDDGLPQPGNEGTFGICNFWMAENLARAGKLEEAWKWYESLLKRDNSVGLWSEEIDADSGEFLGNYPQGFTHIGLINAALTLSQVKQACGRVA